MKYVDEPFIQSKGRVTFRVPLLCLLMTALSLVPAYALPVDKKALHDNPFDNLPPGSVPAIVSSLLPQLPQEYQVRENSTGFVMANPEHGLNIVFSREGLHVRTEMGNFNMVVSGIGSPESINTVQKVTPRNENGRLLYDRDEVTEWYVNSPWGVEQGFTINSIPKGGSRDTLVIDIALAGDYEFSMQAETLIISNRQGNPIVSYSGLQAFDAGNTILPAYLTLAGNTMRINVDTMGAKYPVTIDPFIQTAKLTASDGTAGDWFGNSVAISGDTIVVGTSHDNSNTGSAYVFTKPGGGWSNMTQAAKLTANDGAPGDWFGESVAISGDTIVIGTRRHNSAIGAAYVYTKPVSGWADMTQTAKLAASDGAAGDWLGMSVSISDDTVVAGATNHNSFTGAAYLFTKPVSGWADMTQTAKLTASDGEGDPSAGGDQFGYSVAISGDTVVVGALLDDFPYCFDVGSAYVFTKPVSGWSDATQTAKLTSSDGECLDYFGTTVAISDETIVVGATDENILTGSAYVFTKPVSGWANATQTAKLTASDGAIMDRFGYSLSISGNTIVVGTLAGSDDIPDNAYVFVKQGSDWSDMTQTTKLAVRNGTVHDYFGSAVAIEGDTIVIGAFGTNSYTGTAYIYNFVKSNFSWPIFIPAITNSVH